MSQKKSLMDKIEGTECRLEDERANVKRLEGELKETEKKSSAMEGELEKLRSQIASHEETKSSESAASASLQEEVARS